MGSKAYISKNFLLFIKFVLGRMHVQNLLYFLPLFFVYGRWRYTSMYVIFLFGMFFFDRIYNNKKIYVPSRVTLYVIFITGLIAFYKAPKTPDGFYYFLGTIFAPILLFIYITNIPITRGLILKLVNLMIVVGVILSLFSIYVAIYFLGSFKFRLPSIWQDFNILAAFLMVLIFFCMTFLFSVEDKGRKLFYAISLALILIGLFLTQTRGIWIASLISISFYIFKKPKALLLYLLILALLLFFFFPIILNRYLSVRYFFYDWSAVGRIQAWYATYLMLKDYWLFGAGFDSFLYLKHYYISFFLIEVVHSHNTYLRLWLELGIFGFIAYISIFFKSLFYTLRLHKYYTDRYYLSLIEALRISFIGLSVGFMFEPYFSLYGNSTIIIWLLMGITYNLKLSGADNGK